MDTGRKLNVHKTFNLRLRSVSKGVYKCPPDTKLTFLIFSERSPTLTCNLTRHIKLHAYVRTSCWSAKSILMSVRPHGFMNFLQIGRCKEHIDARSQFYHFVGNIRT